MLKVLLNALAIIALVAVIAAPIALSDDQSIAFYGQVTLNGAAVDGATVTCNGHSYTTSKSIIDGAYFMDALPTGKDYPITATYTSGNNTYKASDDVNLIGVDASQVSQNQQLNALELQLVVSPTPTPTPDPNATATPTATPTTTPTATPTAIPNNQQSTGSGGTTYNYPGFVPTGTPMPTLGTDLSQLDTSKPATRQVFSSPKWETDHETISVVNNGGPITVVAWINDPSNNLTFPIDAGASKTISTSSVMTQPNQILNLGFDAYDHGQKIDTYKATISVNQPTAQTSTPTKTQSPGVTIILAFLCLLGAAYLAIKKEH